VKADGNGVNMSKGKHSTFRNINKELDKVLCTKARLHKFLHLVYKLFLQKKEPKVGLGYYHHDLGAANSGGDSLLLLLLS
jgi:hypothetical protein